MPTTTSAATYDPALPTAAVLPPSGRSTTAVLLPVAVGVLLGPVDLLLQHVLPYPLANLANSSAGWALVAFGVGWAVAGRRPWWPAVAGTITLVLAVESYYLAGVLLEGFSPATLVDALARLWLALGVAGGIGFGTAGAWARSGGRWRGPVGTSVAVGVLLTEAWVRLARVAGTSASVRYRHDAVQTALVLLVLAAVTTVVAGRSARQRIAGLAIALPVALGGALAASLLGFVSG